MSLASVKRARRYSDGRYHPACLVSSVGDTRDRRMAGSRKKVKEREREQRKRKKGMTDDRARGRTRVSSNLSSCQFSTWRSLKVRVANNEAINTNGKEMGLERRELFLRFFTAFFYSPPPPASSFAYRRPTRLLRPPLTATLSALPFRTSLFLRCRQPAADISCLKLSPT